MTATMEAPVIVEIPKPEINYRPKGSIRFGKYTRATILPRWVIEQSGRTAEQLVRDGIVEETSEPVIEDFQAPPPKGANDHTPAIAEENSNLRRENERLRQESKTLFGNNESLRAQVATQVTSLGELTMNVTHWRQQAEAHRAACTEAEKRARGLEDELKMERETKPEPKTPAKK